MKIKSLFVVLIVLTLLTCNFVIPTSAKEVAVNENIEIIILDENVSVGTRTKIERYFATGEPIIENNIDTYGITCSLLGHKITSTAVAVTTHKVRATAPRCVQKTYNYEECSRCDYENSTLIKTEYIPCC